jgi:hypothetical protein
LESRRLLAVTINEFPVPSGVNEPDGIATAPDGNLGLTESGAGQIGEVVPNDSQAVSPTTTTLAVSANPATVGQPITFVANVSSTGGTPDGSVNFLDGTTVLNGVPVALGGTGTATFSTALLDQGTHSITAVFVDNSSFQTSSSAALSLTVNAATTTSPTTASPTTASPTTTTLAVSANPATVGQPITFVANVSSTGGTPDGSVNFLDGTTVLNGVPVALGGTGTATFSTALLDQGTHSITADFVGNSSFQTSSSAALSLTVNAATTTATAPQAMGISGVDHSKQGLTSITIAFNKALDPSSARDTDLYTVLGAVKKGGNTVYSKRVAVKSVSYVSNARALTINLAKPYKGAVQVAVQGSLLAENGVTSSGPYH